MKKIGLVLEGGAMRGMYTAGVLDTLMENNIKIDGIIGVSAGALFGVNYFSKQKGRALRYTLKYSKDLRYMSMLSLLFTGNIVNKNFAYYKVSNKLDPFDDKTFIKNGKEYYATVTNMNTGKSEYIKINSALKNMEVLRASSAMPIVSKPVLLNNNYYLDGAISDSIPVLKMKELGYDKIIVVQTRPEWYKKEKFNNTQTKEIELKYKKYPNFVKAMKNRYKMYNNTLDIIKKMSNNNEIFVIRPSEDINIKVIERNKQKLKSVYDLGVNDTNKLLKELNDYLKK